MCRVEKLSMAQLRELCAILKVEPPASCFKLDEARRTSAPATLQFEAR